MSRVSEPTTWAEIQQRFPNQWVALVEIDWSDERDNALRMAFVAGHGARKEACREARPLRTLFASLGEFFTGDSRAPSLPIVYTS